MKRAKAIAVIGDTHSNSPFGLMPPTFTLDTGNVIHQNKYQEWLWACWLDYCAALDAYDIEAIIHNGDPANGINASRDVQTLSVNEADQIRFATETLKPLNYKPNGRRRARLYMTRGTGYHDGKGGSRAELIAERLGSVPDENGNYARWQLWLRWNGKLIFATHHISRAPVYPYTPLARAQNEAKLRAANGWLLPDVDIRSHVHHCNVIQDSHGRWALTTPAWQLATEYAHKVVPGALPDVGGIILWLDDEGEIQIKRKLYPLQLPAVEEI